MKNNLFKKSMSVFLSVLMLMTCWVFVAPTKAEAATNITMNYPYTINTSNLKNGNKGGHIFVYYYPVNDDGTLDKSSKDLYVIADGSFSDGVESPLSGTAPGFPWKILVKTVSNWGSSSIKLESFYVGNINVLNGGSWTTDSGKTRSWEQGQTTDGITMNWSDPTWSVSSALGGATLQVPSYGTRTSGSLSASFKDNYNVTWPQNYVNYSISGTGATLSSTTNSTTVSVTNAALANFSAGSSTANLTLTASGAGKTSTSTITLNAPKKDVTFENLFSLSDWHYSDSFAYDSSKGEVVVENDSTIKINKSVAGSELTTGSSYPSAHSEGRYSIPVTGGKDYTVRFNTTSSTTGNVSPEVFLFWYDINNNPVNNTAGSATFDNRGFSGNGDHSVTFTAPTAATKAEIRFDNDCPTSGSTLRFNNIAVYPAERGTEIELESWGNRPYTKAYTYKAALGTSFAVPTRAGYSFNGWYRDSNNNDIMDAGEAVTDANGNVLQTFAVDNHYNLKADWVIKTLDVGYDNLFSLSDWAYSDSSKSSNTTRGEVSYDLDAGTITVNTDNSGEVYTNYGTASNHYQMAVEPNTEYIFKADMNLDSGTKGQMFVFFYDANGAGLTGAVYNGSAQTSPHIGIYPTSNGTQNITFTTPANCTQMAIRVGATDVGTTATYSKIGFFKKADYDAYAKDYSKVREPFKVTDTNNLSLNPSRADYAFNGWVDSDGNAITSVAGLKASETVYATWTKLYTVTFLNGDGSVLGTATVKDGEAIADTQYPVANPTKASDDGYSYNFSDWGSVPAAITTDLTLTPNFNQNAHGNFIYIEEAPATCTENAKVQKYCGNDNCGYYFGIDYYSDSADAHPEYMALGHSYTGSIVSGTSTGKKDTDTHEVQCIRYDKCGTTTTEVHSWTEGTTEGANCVTPGTVNWNCPCSETKTTTGTTAPNVHANTTVVGKKDATCLADGYTGDTVCNDCGKTTATGSIIGQLGHSFTNYVYNNDAECEIDGTETATCDRCDATDERTKVGSALEHNWENTEKYIKTEANCTDNEVYYKECSLCGISSESKTGATWTKEGTKWNHKFDGAYVTNNNGTHVQKCTNTGCSATGNQQTCTYGAWTTDNALTHSHTCTACKYTPAAEDHKWSAWTSTNAAGTAAGQQTRSCSVCGKVETINCTYATEHFDATCTEDAYTTYTCSECGHGYTVIDLNTKTGHNFTGEYIYDTTSDTHQQLCANGCGTYGVGTTANSTEPCSWTYKNKEDGKHTASCVCGNSQVEDCTGGTATCTAKAVCEKCTTVYGSTAPHSFTGTAVKLEGDKHAYLCVYCSTEGIYGVGANQGYTEGCSGGTATCTAKAECTVCGDTHGELNANAHKWGDATPDGDGTHTYICEYNPDHTKSGDCVCTSPAVLPSDCETAGYQQNYCDDCGYAWQTAPTDPLGHKWSAWVNNNDGTHTRTCERAGCVYGENGTAKAETVDCTKANATYVVTDPTCTEGGYTTYTCNDCGYVWEDDEVDAKGHTWENTKTYLKSEEDCLNDAVYYQECSVCNISAQNDTTATGTTWTDTDSALGHDFTEEVKDEAHCHTPADCTTDAVYYKECSRCDVISTSEDDLWTDIDSALGHAWTNTEKYVHTVSDCITDAVYYKECSRCNISSQGETDETWTKENSKSGHKFETEGSHTAYKAPTCTEKGNIEYYTCDLCGEKFSDEGVTKVTKLEIAALDHDWKDVAFKAPSCEEDGHSAYKDCSRCDEIKGKVTAGYEATGHNFSGAYTYDSVNGYHSKYCINDNCLADGEKAYGIGNDKYAVEYDGIDYVITGGEKCDFTSSEALTDENGIHSHKLTCVCGNATSKAYADEVTFVETVAPTCTADGYDAHQCPDCGDTWQKNVVTTDGHDLAEKATSNGDGTHSVKCSKCDYVENEAACSGGTATCKDFAKCEVCGSEYGEKTDHSISEDAWISNGDATCTEDGTKSQKCTVCYEEVKVTDVGSKLGHSMTEYGYELPEGWDAEDFDEATIKAPTCSEEGLSIAYCTNEDCMYFKTKSVKKDSTAHVWATDANGEILWEEVGGDCSTGITYKKTCTVCGAIEGKTVTSVGHTMVVIVDSAATCEDDHYTISECSVCGYTEKTIDEGTALGHAWNLVAIKEPTCATSGRGERTCSNCNKVESVKLQARCHVWDTDADGLIDSGFDAKAYIDSLDGKVPQFIYVEATDATCDKAGYNEYFKCLDCSYDQHLDERWLAEAGNYKAPTGHADTDGDGKCDSCKDKVYSSDSGNKTCGCICHEENWLLRIIYKILNFFWKLFRIKPSCNCGATHY